jgi:hypothetical protein
MPTRSQNKMVIITSYVDGESYGLLGPQMAATIINKNCMLSCIVVPVTRNDDKAELKKALQAYFGSGLPLIGFSTLSGREDLFQFAGELKAEGALTLLAGPQAGIDFLGETGWRENPERFEGYSAFFDYALQGPAEQVLPLLMDLSGAPPESISGLLYQDDGGGIQEHKAARWCSEYLKKVDWECLYRFGPSGFVPLRISSAQVLQQIGCPHAVRTKVITIDPPAFMPAASPISLPLSGCSFCDVAVDKGFCGAVEPTSVLEQIAGLPAGEDGRKIPFELINENPFTGLPKLLSSFIEENLQISQINITTRADYLVRGENHLVDALKMARRMRIRIVCVSVGFESFDDGILRNLNKGITVAENLEAVALMRRLKRLFPFQWGYLRSDGGNHGFIHPTPWDTPESAAVMEQMAKQHGLPFDIFPAHSTPLIIHHGSGLGEWIRELEKQTGTTFKRNGTIIEWWEKDQRFMEAH